MSPRTPTAEPQDSDDAGLIMVTDQSDLGPATSVRTAATETIVRRDEHDFEVPVAQVSFGDIAIVRPGDGVPTDGVVVEGSSHLDKSLLSGESTPVSKNMSDLLAGGAITSERMPTLKTTPVASEAIASNFIGLAKDAQSVKATIRRLVDKVSAVFVPIVLLIATATFFGWGLLTGDWQNAFLNAVSVMVIACPFALGLATPTSIVAGTRVAAKYGILIKDVKALETTQAVDVVVFDKTGTLTEGKPAVISIHGFSRPELEVLALARAVQQYSDHPLARAVEVEAVRRDFPMRPATAAQALPGRGVRADVDGMTVYLGNHRMLKEIGLVSGEGEIADSYEHAGRTVSWLAVEEAGKTELVGFLAFDDTVKDSARAAVERLRSLGVMSVMLTGDNYGSAKSVAAAVDINVFRAEALPADKAYFVAELRAEGKVVAMVSDGIHDTPALAAADIGMAMSTGTDAPKHAAGITLMRGDPILAVDAIDISKRTYRKIRQNLGGAFLYNIVGIPLAALGYLNPVIAGAAMAFSSVSVVANSLLLHRWKPSISTGGKQ